MRNADPTPGTPKAVPDAAENAAILAFCERSAAAAWRISADGRTLLDLNPKAAAWWGRTGKSAAPWPLSELLADLRLDTGPAHVGLRWEQIRSPGGAGAASAARDAWLRHPARGWQPIRLAVVPAPPHGRARGGAWLVARCRSLGEAEPAPLRDLASIAAHELNNITASIGGFVELAGELPQAASASLASYLGEILTGIERARRLATDLTAFGPRPQRLPAHFPAASWIRGASGRATQNSLTFRWLCARAAVLRGDPDPAEQALARLLDDAAGPGTHAASSCRIRAIREPALRCQTCSAPLTDPLVEAAVPVADLGPAAIDALRHPARLRQHMRKESCFALATAIELIHQAGGHVHWSVRSPGVIGLLLPVA